MIFRIMILCFSFAISAGCNNCKPTLQAVQDKPPAETDDTPVTFRYAFGQVRLVSDEGYIKGSTWASETWWSITGVRINQEHTTCLLMAKHVTGATFSQSFAKDDYYKENFNTCLNTSTADKLVLTEEVTLCGLWAPCPQQLHTIKIGLVPHQ